MSGTLPDTWLAKLNPKLIVLGEAPSKDLQYYPSRNTMTQNSTGDILFDCQPGRVHIYVNEETYNVEYLHNDGLDHLDGLYYVGSLHL